MYLPIARDGVGVHKCIPCTASQLETSTAPTGKVQPHQRILKPSYLESTSTRTKLESDATSSSRSHLIPFKRQAIRIASLTSIGICNFSRLDSSLTSGQVICHTLLSDSCVPPSATGALYFFWIFLQDSP